MASLHHHQSILSHFSMASRRIRHCSSFPCRFPTTAPPPSVSSQERHPQLTDVRLAHRKEMTVLLQELLTERESRQQATYDLLCLQYEHRDLKRAFQRLENKYNLRGALEDIAAKHAAHIPGGVQAQLNHIKSHPRFSTILGAIAARHMLPAADVEDCIGNIYHTMGKHFDATSIGRDSRLVIDTTPMRAGTGLAAGDGAALEAFLQFDDVPYVVR